MKPPRLTRVEFVVFLWLVTASCAALGGCLARMVSDSVQSVTGEPVRAGGRP